MDMHSQYLKLKEYREHFKGSLIEKRSTYLSDLNQLAAIQLSVIFLYKKRLSTSSLSDADLIQLQRKINKQAKKSSAKLDQTPSNLKSICSFLEIYDAYRKFIKECNLIDDQDVDLFVSRLPQQQQDAKDGNKQFREPATLGQSVSPACISSPSNSTVLRVQSVIISYLQLVVNPKDEIALSRVIDCPLRGIDQKSFTEIRKMATEKGLSMYQVISSFVRQLTLGGKGYVPNEHHTLYKTKEGLIDFMVLMDKLQTIIDEARNMNEAIVTILKTLKLSFIRAKTPVFKAPGVNGAVESLQKEYTKYSAQVSSSQQLELELCLQGYIDWISCHGYGVTSEQLCGVLSTPKTAERCVIRKLPSLKTQFTTPDCTDETPIKKANEDKKVIRKREIRNFGGFGILEEMIEVAETKDEVQHEVCESLIDSIPTSNNQQEIQLIRCHDSNNSPLAISIVSPKPVVKNSSKDAQNPAKDESISQKLSSKKTIFKGKENVNKKGKIPTKDQSKKPAKVVKKKKPKILPGQKTLGQFFK